MGKIGEEELVVAPETDTFAKVVEVFLVDDFSGSAPLFDLKLLGEVESENPVAVDLEQHGESLQVDNFF